MILIFVLLGNNSVDLLHLLQWIVSTVALPSLRFQGSLLFEDSLFYSVALLYQPLLDRHGTWLIGYRSREAIQLSRDTHVIEKNKKADTRHPAIAGNRVSTFYVIVEWF